MQIINCEQGTPEWHQARLGIVTCSELHKVLAKGQGKTRKTYMCQLIGEKFTGEATESFRNVHTERGHEQEPVVANELYSAFSDNTVHEVGFCVRYETVTLGYSPDGLINDDGALEIKAKLAHLQVALLDSDKVPSENYAQIQGGLWVTQREWLDFVSYCPGLPLFTKRVYPDLEYQAAFVEELEKFYIEMAAIENKIKCL